MHVAGRLLCRAFSTAQNYGLGMAHFYSSTIHILGEAGGTMSQRSLKTEGETWLLDIFPNPRDSFFFFHIALASIELRYLHTSAS